MSDDALAEYRRKRDFSATPEPAGTPAAEGAGGAEAPGGEAPSAPTARSGGNAGSDGDEAVATGRFVVQQHDATRLHWDLRLEGDGVLWSWALPRGLPWDPKRNNLAVHTEDHPLEYLTFEGDIPDGTYGAGHMFVWDHGDYELLSRKDGKLVFRLHGERVDGRYSLFRTGAERDWMIHRMDPPADPERRWPPEFVPPMRATAGAPRPGRDWAWEVRLSGLRVMATLLTGAVRLHAGDGTEVSDRFVDVRRIGRATGSVEAVLDGVLVGLPEHLDRRMRGQPMPAQRASRSVPVSLVVFDLVWLEGHPLWDRSWDDRRGELEALGIDGPHWSTSTAHIGDGPALVEAAAAGHDVTGLVGKRRDAPYRPGETSPDWIEIALR